MTCCYSSEAANIAIQKISFRNPQFEFMMISEACILKRFWWISVIINVSFENKIAFILVLKISQTY